jgi:negative regulator of replication initiation
MLHQDHPQDFDQVFSLRGRRRTYFAPDNRSMTAPVQIPGTAIFVETNLSANDVMKRCRELMTLFGYAQDGFRVELESR